VERHRGEVKLDSPSFLVQPLDGRNRLGRQLCVGRGALGQFVGVVVGLPGHGVDAVLERPLQGPVGRDLQGLRTSVPDGRPEALPLVAVTFRHACSSAPYSSEHVRRVDVESQVPLRAKGQLCGCFQLC
jgi:hypothetical protein